ncbi:MAG TPA: DNA cytosine methyltransferase [Phycisphaerae bacterium]|nr:DNA cytosine methyltransferase [Phycisphaerae bacterium]
MEERSKGIPSPSPICAVDLFCGAGGLTHGLRQAGIEVRAGIDIDPQARFAYERNNPGSEFLCWDVSRKRSPSIGRLFDRDKISLLAGCAPCQPFSRLTNGIRGHEAWDLLDNFGRFVAGVLPELVTMENVPELASRGREVLERFLSILRTKEYFFDWALVRCVEYGIPQARQRLVLLASRLGPIAIPAGSYMKPSEWKTVRQTIGDLPPLASGAEDPVDPLHVAAKLSPINLRRIRATRHDGGTRKDWPDDLVLDCHRKESGESYGSIYARMWWDRPSPTMTTLCTGIGNGRFGHPEQDRAITLREAALFQSFPRTYEFWPRGQTVNRKAVGRMIGNAIPPRLAQVLGEALLKHVAEHT